MLSSKKHYLQVALNSTLAEAQRIIATLPISDRILIEAGTPLIKEFGAEGISKIRNWWQARLTGISLKMNISPSTSDFLSLLVSGMETYRRNPPPSRQKLLVKIFPYIVADLKAMDRGEHEVKIAAGAGASAAVVLGLAPVETIDAFIESCDKYNLDAMVDMMNVEKPYQILRKLRELPKVVILHRGVDETEFSDKPLPIHMINKIKGAFDVMISVAGGDTTREIQSSVFNGADIVVLWKDFYRTSQDSARIADEFLQTIK